MIQDIAPHRFHNEYRPDAVLNDESPVLRFDKRNPLAKLVKKDGRLVPEFPQARYFDKEKLFYAFSIDDTEYFLDISGSTGTVEGFEFIDFRSCRKDISHRDGMVIFTGDHLNQWYGMTRFCGGCGATMTHSEAERAMRCPSCGKTYYPNIMPAVIVGVTNGNSLLMTKYKEGIRYYALVAGFVEIGETLEECVAREVMEETGVKVKNIRYYKSQPWGMARDILAGFYCDLDGDDTIVLDTNELKIAEWVKREDIELQPDDYSLTNEMMKTFKEGRVNVK